MLGLIKKMIGRSWWPKSMSLAHTMDCRVSHQDDETGLGFQRLHLFIYLAMYLLYLPYGLLDTYFILWFIILVLSFNFLLAPFHFGYLAIHVVSCVRILFYFFQITVLLVLI